MGNAQACNKCPTGDSSVVNLSDRLVLKLTEGVVPPPEQQRSTPGLQQEHDHIEKIKCIDNSHTAAYGLTAEGVDKQRNDMLAFLAQFRVQQESRAKVILLECLKQNADCTAKCFREMEEYIDWVDARRMALLKEQRDAGVKAKVK